MRVEKVQHAQIAVEFDVEKSTPFVSISVRAPLSALYSLPWMSILRKRTAEWISLSSRTTGTPWTFRSLAGRFRVR